MLQPLALSSFVFLVIAIRVVLPASITTAITAPIITTAAAAAAAAVTYIATSSTGFTFNFIG